MDELVQKLQDAVPLIAFCGGLVWFAVRQSWIASAKLTNLEMRVAALEHAKEGK